MTKAVVVYSGGMDSFTLLHLTVQEFGVENVCTISFDYEQRHKKELIYAAGVCERLKVAHRVVHLGVLNPLLGGSSLTRPEIAVPEGHYEHESMKITVVPGRNTIMLAIAMGYAQSIEADQVMIGVHAGDHAIYPDCRPEYISSMSTVFGKATEATVLLRTPFLYLSKGDILQKGLLHYGLRPDDYANTWTCYKGEEHPCGKCGACQERREAFAFANVPDPTAVTPAPSHASTGSAGRPDAGGTQTSGA